MQPVFTQVPPNNFRSMTATFMPVSTKRAASDGPACPVPMMMASNFCIFLTSTPATTNEAATGTENLAVDAACSDAPVYQADAQIGHETRRPAYIKIGITRHPQFLEQTDIQTSASVE